MENQNVQELEVADQQCYCGSTCQNHRQTGVTYIDKEYFVNESKKTVVCKLHYAINPYKIKNFELINEIYGFGIFNMNVYNKYGLDLRYNASTDGYTYVGVVTGKAKCMDGDTFDIEFAKKLALTRAQEKAFSNAQTLYTEMATFVLKEMFESLDNLAEGAYNAAGNCFWHEGELIYGPLSWESEEAITDNNLENTEA